MLIRLNELIGTVGANDGEEFDLSRELLNGNLILTSTVASATTAVDVQSNLPNFCDGYSLFACNLIRAICINGLILRGYTRGKLLMSRDKIIALTYFSVIFRCVLAFL